MSCNEPKWKHCFCALAPGEEHDKRCPKWKAAPPAAGRLATALFKDGRNRGSEPVNRHGAGPSMP